MVQNAFVHDDDGVCDVIRAKRNFAVVRLDLRQLVKARKTLQRLDVRHIGIGVQLIGNHDDEIRHAIAESDSILARGGALGPADIGQVGSRHVESLCGDLTVELLPGRVLQYLEALAVEPTVTGAL